MPVGRLSHLKREELGDGRSLEQACQSVAKDPLRGDRGAFDE
jgi:hypothetical protein